MDNICKFVPIHNTTDTLHTVNFVYETYYRSGEYSGSSSVYRVHLVTSGTGKVGCAGVTRDVKRGDIFFIFPGMPYSISGDSDFKYMYISYIGIRAGAEMERLHITSRNFVFENFAEIEGFWHNAIGSTDKVFDLISEAVVLYTFAKIGERLQGKDVNEKTTSAGKFLLIKKYIDDSFADPSLTLTKLGQKFSYSEKYLSQAFKNAFGIGISKYLNTVRINQACVLMNEGYTGISDIARLCGYSDPLYFSKIFKQHMGISPSEYIKGR